jgi:hypothetical protein
MGTLLSAAAGAIMAALLAGSVSDLAYADDECSALAAPYGLHETPIMADGSVLCVVDCDPLGCAAIDGLWEMEYTGGYCEIWTVLEGNR